MAEAQHSLFSASGAPRWIPCPGSIVLSAGLPDNGSIHSATGTVAHSLLEAYQVRSAAPEGAANSIVKQDGYEVVVDDTMVSAVRQAADQLDWLTRGADLRQAERRLNYAKWLGVPTEDAWGTADALAAFIDERKLLVADYKNGHQPVTAEENEQMMLYAGGALLEMDELGIDIDTIQMVILQPHVSSEPTEWTCTRAELEAWLLGRARSGATSVRLAQQTVGAPEWETTFLNPGAKQCRWCKAKATCPALRGAVHDTVFGLVPETADDFADLTGETTLDLARVADAGAGGNIETWLSVSLDKVDLIEDWCKGVRAEVERRLVAGDPVRGYKLVQGKKGNRSWVSAADAEALLKTMRVKQDVMYDFMLKSPTQIAKLGPAFDKDGKVKPPKEGAEPPVIGPRQWPKVAALITQSEGKLHVAPASDPRPAVDVKPATDSFSVLVDASDLV